jgi:uncharacterized protein YcfJ
MKNTVLTSAVTTAVIATASCGAMAQEFGRVISSTPAVQQVGVPRQVCTQQQAAVNAPKSGAGALMGAIAGGGLGNAVGQGGGKALATLAGVMGGAILGNNIEGPNTQVQTVQQCSTQTFYENRTMGYNVVYEYGGKQYNVQMPNEPGPTIQLQVSPVGANNNNNSNSGYSNTYPSAPPYEQQPVSAVQQPVQAVMQSGYTYVNPGVVTYAPAYAPTYYAAPYPSPYYAPIGVSLGVGYGVGYYRGFGHHRHWR